ncbi:MAG: FHA domain-containing protein, partial [Planctomycetes bacterium]|nr:FHA domain-containing protein [Planctomycetota bacterium]
MATIHVIQGPDKGRTFELRPQEMILGRQSDDIPLTDPTVSRNHAQLAPRAGAWLIEDLGSANGTYVNGVRLVRPHRLQQGDQIRIAGTLLVFGGPGPQPIRTSLDIDEDGRLVDSAIMASIPSSEDSIIMPTPEAGAQAIGNLRQLYHITSTISTIFDVDLLLNRVLDHVFELLRPDRAYVLTFDAAGRMTPKAARYRNNEPTQQAPISRTIINHVINKRVGVLCSNAMSDKRFTTGGSVHEFGIRSALCVPIIGRDRILGVLHVDSSVSNNTYSTEQLRLLTAIGYQTGLAVENVQLYEAAVKSERLAAIGQTVASLSHHIKNILQALLAGTDVVKMAMDKNQLARAKESWPIVTRNLDRINRVILNMLAFSKQREPLLQQINVNAVIAECIELITPQADEKHAAVMRDLEDLPPIHADMAGLNQALLNLLTNAIDAVPEQNGVITVASRFDPISQKLTVAVSDNGPGIAAEARDHLFEPFFSTKGQKGTGLGLAVTKKVVAEHGGDIE